MSVISKFWLVVLCKKNVRESTLHFFCLIIHNFAPKKLILPSYFPPVILFQHAVQTFFIEREFERELTKLYHYNHKIIGQLEIHLFLVYLMFLSKSICKIFFLIAKLSELNTFEAKTTLSCILLIRLRFQGYGR